MKIKVITWDDGSRNAFLTNDNTESFVEWKTKLGYVLVSESEMSVSEYDSIRGIES